MTQPRSSLPFVLVAQALLLLGCAGPDQAPADVDAQGPGTSRQITECNFQIEFAHNSAALDTAARGALRAAIPRARDQASAAVLVMNARGEMEGITAARFDAIRDQFIRGGVKRASIRQIQLYDLPPSEAPRANVNVCARWDDPLRRWRSEPEDPQRLIEYRLGATVMRVPLVLLGPYVWNDVPLGRQDGTGHLWLYLSRREGESASIPAIRACVEGPNRDAACRELIRVTLQRWLWAPELDPPEYRLPADGSTRPSPRARTSYTVSRSRHPAGPASFVAEFTLLDGRRVIADGRCIRHNAVARADASAFVSDGQASCTFRMLRITPTMGASLFFNIDRLDEAPSIIERARVALLRFVAP